MNIQIILLLTAVIVTYIVGIDCNPYWNIAIYKTKVARYKLRGKLQVPSARPNYCNKALCPKNVKHIACNSVFWGPHCQKPRNGINLIRIKYKILDFHNTRRARLCKDAPNNRIPVAKELPPILWDEELSILAMRVTNFCNDAAASQCVNTYHYRNVGRSSYSGFYYTIQDAIRLTLEELYLGVKHIDKSTIDSFPKNASASVRRFANLANMRVTRVGCGYLKQGNLGLIRRYYMTCLYNHNLRAGEAIFERK